MIEFVLPIPEKISLNKIYSGMHWSKRNDLKDVYHQYIDFYTKSLRQNSSLLDFPVKVVYIPIWKTRPLDLSNGFLIIKFFEDGLVHSGILPDDTIHYVGNISSECIVNKDLPEDFMYIRIEPHQHNQSQETHILSLIDAFRKYNSPQQNV